MARRRFFVESVHSGQARISGHDAHHLTRVLRVEPGQKFEISDNREVYLAEVVEARKDLVGFAVLERLEAPKPVVQTTVLASLIKFERFEWLVEKATELGASRIVPVEAERSEKGLARAAVNRLERWKRIAREASEQSRRATLPEIDNPLSLDASLATAATLRYVLDEEAAPGIISVLPDRRAAGTSVALLVGPQGGWTDRERSAFADAGWCCASLGQQILRAETAAIAALAIVNAAWAT